MNIEKPLAAAIKKPVATVLVYGVLLVLGLYALVRIPVEVLPRFDYPEIAIIVHYPGATTEDLENQVCRPLEGSLLVLPALSSLRSVMGQNTLEIDARFRGGSSAQMDLQATYSAIDRSRALLPPSVHPRAEIMGAAIDEVADYALEIPAGVRPMVAQRAVLTRVALAVRAVSGIRRVEVFGSGTESLWIQPNPMALRHYGVSWPDSRRPFGNRFCSGRRATSGSGTRTSSSRPAICLRGSTNSPRSPSPLPRVPFHCTPWRRYPSPPGPSVTGGSGRQADHRHARVQARQRVHPACQAAVARTVRSLAGELPAGTHWIRIYSQGHLVRLIGHDLGRNLVMGGILAILVLFWLLGMHRGVWILARASPCPSCRESRGSYFTGQSLNLLTLGALSVAVGLLADDGIIVLESIYHRWELGFEGREGIRRGLLDIASPDVTGTMTTVSVFLPFLFVGGLAALFLVPFALAMGLSLLASLVISLTLIPLLLALAGPPRRGSRAAGAGVVGWLERRNERLLGLTLSHPRWSLATAVVLLFVSAGVLVFVPFDFLPLPNEGVLLDSFTLPPGTALKETRGAVSRLTAKLRADHDVAHTLTRIGSAGGTSYTEPDYAGEIQVRLKPGVDVKSLDRLAARLVRESEWMGCSRAWIRPQSSVLARACPGCPSPSPSPSTGIASARSGACRTRSRRASGPCLT